MVAKEYADFEPKAKIPADEFIDRQRENGVKLTREDCLAVDNALKRYERLYFLVSIGEGKQLPTKLCELEEVAGRLIGIIKDIQQEEGYIWESLAEKSKVRISPIEQLLEQCRELNRQVPRRTKAQIRAFLLNILVSELADIYTAATGKKATINKGAPTKRDDFAGGRGGRFLKFLRSALNYLPDECRPAQKTVSGIGSRFARIEHEKRVGKVISPNWIGLPYLALTRPNWKDDPFRRITGKRP